MKEATIYDYARMCRTFKTCGNCPLCTKNNGTNLSCNNLLIENPNKANEIILKWCEEHPVKTRQSELLKAFPNVLNKNGHIDICPERFDMNFLTSGKCYEYLDCEDCKKAYWFAEIDGNESKGKID